VAFSRQAGHQQAASPSTGIGSGGKSMHQHLPCLAPQPNSSPHSVHCIVAITDSSSIAPPRIST